ncbi:hypothetical protein D1872_297070 [compost metagenome]
MDPLPVERMLSFVRIENSLFHGDPGHQKQKQYQGNRPAGRCIRIVGDRQSAKYTGKPGSDRNHQRRSKAAGYPQRQGSRQHHQRRNEQNADNRHRCGHRHPGQNREGKG